MADRPDVLFVVLDSARKARLSPYGHERDTTPALDALAASATVHEAAHTPTPWTLPSHCSLFTGRYPSEHGITNGFADRGLQLPADLPTLAERLADRGYRTAGFSNNPWVGQLSGLDRGFDTFVEWDLEISRDGATGVHTRRDRLYDRGHTLLGQAARTPVYLLKRRFFTSNLVDRATRWLEAGDGAPTFTFLNLMEAHSPYYPPRSAFRALGLEPPNPVEPRRLNLRLLAYLLGRADVDDHRERLLEYYDASLRYQDREFGRLLAALRSGGGFDDALVVVCADHGKNLGEFARDGEVPHYLRNVNTNVPLVVKRPGQRTPERVDEPFELVRLFDLLRTGGASPPPAATNGYALVEDFVPHTGKQAQPVTRWRALAGRDRKYVRNEDGVEFVLAGAGEDDVVVEASPEELQELRGALEERVARLEGRRSVAEEAGEGLGSGVEAQLEDLGYL